VWNAKEGHGLRTEEAPIPSKAYKCNVNYKDLSWQEVLTIIQNQTGVELYYLRQVKNNKVFPFVGKSSLDSNPPTPPLK
jgi:ABC-type Fe2+-enterobactin transport system substrate-binding protein